MRLGEEKGLSAASRQHVAVMVDEVVGLVRASKPMLIVDATVGYGWTCRGDCSRPPMPHLLGIDRDAAALACGGRTAGAFWRRA